MQQENNIPAHIQAIFKKRDTSTWTKEDDMAIFKHLKQSITQHERKEKINKLKDIWHQE